MPLSFGPRLQHVPSLLNELGAVVRAAKAVASEMGELRLDHVRAESKPLVEHRPSRRTKAVTRHFLRGEADGPVSLTSKDMLSMSAQRIRFARATASNELFGGRLCASRSAASRVSCRDKGFQTFGTS